PPLTRTRCASKPSMSVLALRTWTKPCKRVGRPPDGCRANSVSGPAWDCRTSSVARTNWRLPRTTSVERRCVPKFTSTKQESPHENARLGSSPATDRRAPGRTALRQTAGNIDRLLHLRFAQRRSRTRGARDDLAHHPDTPQRHIRCRHKGHCRCPLHLRTQTLRRSHRRGGRGGRCPADHITDDV